MAEYISPSPDIDLNNQQNTLLIPLVEALSKQVEALTKKVENLCNNQTQSCNNSANTNKKVRTPPVSNRNESNCNASVLPTQVNNNDLRGNTPNSNNQRSKGLIGALSLTEWLSEPLTFQLPTTSVTREQLAEDPTDISTLLKQLDHHLIKYKKLKTEIAYFRECLSEGIVPKGLCSWQYPTGLVDGLPFHKDLVQLFNRNGCELLEIICKHYELQTTEIMQIATSLNETIQQHSNFIRYQYDYDRIFFCIDQYIDKIKKVKCKKLKRDRIAYSNRLAYPKPPPSQNNANFTSMATLQSNIIGQNEERNNINEENGFSNNNNRSFYQENDNTSAEQISHVGTPQRSSNFRTGPSHYNLRKTTYYSPNYRNRNNTNNQGRRGR
ncbi:probable basic-leucine zipper transcription factor E [Protopterus annectens]|uniref:probable basic-leucine zipper transcription factor E n=1 Tax=Protopterus annectens TaxID=7888 RepID=UPI001CF9ED9F|nr:probable basic-leucine zipper transcription factor E [Protopterus annectens]